MTTYIFGAGDANGIGYMDKAAQGTGWGRASGKMRFKNGQLSNWGYGVGLANGYAEGWGGAGRAPGSGDGRGGNSDD